MINTKVFLSDLIFRRDIELKSTGEGYGEGLILAGENEKNVVVLCADLADSTKASMFKERFPDRFIEVGVAEQLLATVASGMAAYGKTPFISSYAIFSPGRNWEQIRTSIALNDIPVKIGGAHSGFSAGVNGATHQALEDIAIMRVLPNMIIVAPCDAVETRRAVVAASKNNKPTYIRYSKLETEVMTTDRTPFEIGKSVTFWEGKNSKTTIIACGPLVYESLKAAKKLKELKIETNVVNCHTIKPIDEKTIIEEAKKTGAIVTVEEHQQIGGLGGAVSEVLARKYPVPVEFVAVKDSFGETGTPKELIKKYGLTSENIVAAVKRVIGRKI